MEDDVTMKVSEPPAALLSEEVRKSGLLGQVMKLSQPDKEALIMYLKNDVEKNERFRTDEFG